MCRVKRAVRLDQLLSVDAGHPLQGVDVLSVVPQQEALLRQKADEVVARRRTKAPRIELLGQLEERRRVLPEEVDLEDGLRVREVVLLQVVV